ncbi:MAG: AzlD domain-containing protein [Acidimicrobiales bacterium]
MNAYVVVASTALGLLLVRALPLVAGSTGSMPPWLRSSLGFVGPAALGAIVATMTLAPAGSLANANVPLCCAAIGAFLAVRRSGRILHAYVAGFPIYWLALTTLG